MRIVQLNLAFDAAFRDPEQLLDRYHTLTGWSRALTAAGADVRVVQRFSRDATIARDGVVYTFVSDRGRARLPAWSISPPAVASTAAADPDVVHVNGLMFAAMIAAMREALDDTAVVVAQDHSGSVPAPPAWPLRALSRFGTPGVPALRAKSRWSVALGQLDACTFTSVELAPRWHAAGLPESVPIIAIPEASTTFSPVERAAARAATGMSGVPALLWVGRVDANKDPFTVLSGVERASSALPRARLWMVVPAHADDRDVRARIDSSTTLRQRVTMLGAIDYNDMPRFYSAAEVFVSGSHHEGSGYALIEAMACGAVPCVTDIPAFRALAGDCGATWPAGDASALAAALEGLVRRNLDEQRKLVRQRFAGTLSWRSVGQLTFEAYADLLRRRRTAVGQ